MACAKLDLGRTALKEGLDRPTFVNYLETQRDKGPRGVRLRAHRDERSSGYSLQIATGTPSHFVYQLLY